ncbi:MAG: CopG family transcriptional regulator [Thermoplasmata archaeon]|nr:CopG family transcriptional regulator [Thermoplasmata archaeon]
MKKGEEKKFTTVSIPTPLFQKIQDRIKGTGFTSVSSYVAYVLREVITEEPEEEQPFSKEDEERIKDRLRALGYLD